MESFWFSEALGCCDLQDKLEARNSWCTGTMSWGTGIWTRLENGQHGDDLLGSFSWQRLWSKGFSALYLANEIASHEDAKKSIAQTLEV